MHTELERYRTDPRLVLTKIGSDTRSQEVGMLFLYAYDCINEAEWHWLRFHYSMIPPHPTALQIAVICASLEKVLPGMGKQLIDNIANLKNREKHKPDYEAMLQVFAEMLVIDQVFKLNWPGEVEFSYEPSGRSGKRPELSVLCAGKQFLFEVKAPSLLSHMEMRQAREWQVPGRVLPLEGIQTLARGEPITLPRDNPVKDFLVSADSKFSDFERTDGANILVIVWDDFIYEPITSLVNERTGLLLEGSYFRYGEGKPVEFPNIDGVIVIRHLSYFYEGLADRRLPDRDGPFDFGAPGALPNVAFPTRWGREVPSFIYDGLRAVDYRNEGLQMFSDYRPQDVVMWIGDRS